METLGSHPETRTALPPSGQGGLLSPRLGPPRATGRLPADTVCRAHTRAALHRLGSLGPCPTLEAWKPGGLLGASSREHSSGAGPSFRALQVPGSRAFHVHPAPLPRSSCCSRRARRGPVYQPRGLSSGALLKSLFQRRAGSSYPPPATRLTFGDTEVPGVQVSLPLGALTPSIPA